MNTIQNIPWISNSVRIQVIDVWDLVLNLQISVTAQQDDEEIEEEDQTWFTEPAQVSATNAAKEEDDQDKEEYFLFLTCFKVNSHILVLR